MTEIVRGDDSMKYILSYNAFHNPESIGINGKAEKLIRYTNKNGNGRLKQVDVCQRSYDEGNLQQHRSEVMRLPAAATPPVAMYPAIC